MTKEMTVEEILYLDLSAVVDKPVIEDEQIEIKEQLPLFVVADNLELIYRKY